MHPQQYLQARKTLRVENSLLARGCQKTASCTSKQAHHAVSTSSSEKILENIRAGTDLSWTVYYAS